jgi:hypothetical protein
VELPHPGIQWSKEQSEKSKVNPTWKAMENK